MKTHRCQVSSNRSRVVLALAAALFAATATGAAHAQVATNPKAELAKKFPLLGKGLGQRVPKPFPNSTDSSSHGPSKIKPYLNPNGSSDPFPKPHGYWLGVTTHDHGYGPEVSNVSYGSPAHRVGIEPGDVLREVDGIPVATRWELSQAICYSDGYVRLLIEDVRTGNLVYRMVRLRRI